MKFKGENANFHSTIRYHIILNVVLCLTLIASVGLNFSLFQGLSISIPPDLRAGALVKPGEKHPENVFAFTTSVFMSLNSWGENGQKDYPDNIKKLLSFITPNFRNELVDDMKKKNKAGELQGITRQLSLPAEYVFDRDTVTVVNSNEWIVKLPLEVKAVGLVCALGSEIQIEEAPFLVNEAKVGNVVNRIALTYLFELQRLLGLH